MNKIITISRQYGSGGRLIGEMVSKQLNIPFYDSKIIRETMKKTGFTENMIKSTEQRVTNSFLFNLAMGVDESHNHMKIIEQAEHDVIQNLAKQGPCVIIGRSANFILSEKDTLNVFIYSDINDRITYATEHYSCCDEFVACFYKNSSMADNWKSSDRSYDHSIICIFTKTF